MSFERPQPLHKNIEVKAINRPIKIAYLVPYEETENNHWMLDAVFYESYTRWGGAYTLIIPTNSNSFLYEGYDKWLELYDPDFIYTYVDLEQTLIEKIDCSCCPIAFISYKKSEVTRWWDYIPDWSLYFKPVSSLTTIHSPYAGYFSLFPRTEKEQKITFITQFEEISEERFIADNFGTAFNLHMYPNPIPGLFDTLCLVPNDLNERMNVGTTKTTSITDILSQISDKKAITVAKLSMAHSKSICFVQSYRWNSFNLVIGDTCLDRIHFWNARSLSPDYIGVPAALIVKKTQIEESDFITQLGLFLNNHNFIGQSNGQPEVTIRSFSHSIEELKPIQERLQKCTFNRIFLTNEYNNPAIPSFDDFKHYYHSGSADVTTFKLNETINKIQTKEPEHFVFTPPRFKGINEGQWIVELEIERHNNLSRFVNVVDTWMPPVRHKAVRAFTNNLGRISRNHHLALLPSTDAFPLSGPIKKEFSYTLSLPDDETFFHWIVLDTVKHQAVDLRSILNFASYRDMAISDKGQNLRGVISMFESLSEASKCLTNKVWREIIRHQKGNKEDDFDNKNIDEIIEPIYELIKKEAEESGIKNHLKNLFNIGVTKGEEDKKFPDNIFSQGKLESYLPPHNKREQLRKRAKFNKIINIDKYLAENFKDTLEFLINNNVFYQVHQWRCSYCGHTNTLVFDHIKRTNNCEICDTEYFAPIDFEWMYKLNDFVYKSLCERNGLTVLWALGYLQERHMHNSFYYLPEVDLFLEHDNLERKHEIDLLCMIDGKFYAVEAKFSSTGFTKKPDEIEKFIKKISLIRPDVALLAFEQYCDSGANLDSTKQELKKVVEDISQKVGQNLKIETVVATDFTEFNEFPVDLGCWGPRVLKMLDKINGR